MRYVKLLMVLALLAGTACSGDDEPIVRPEDSPAPPASSPAEETPEPTPSPLPPEGGTGCANEGVAYTEARSSDRMLRGDIDGDGDGDRVAIVIDRSAEEERCRAFLVVMNRFGSFPTAIEQEGMSFDVGFPALALLAEIDGEPGLDIVVNLIAGASTQFSGVYTTATNDAGDYPERLTFSRPAEFGDLFPTGGSVGHLEASDCVGPGAIVITTAVPKGDDYKVTRTAYVVIEGRMEPQEEGVSSERIPFDQLDRFPEFANSPFGSCPTS